MANYKFISSKVVISGVFRDFSISNSSWVLDAYEWIGEALEEVGRSYTLVPINCKLSVVDFKAELPAKMETIDMVTYCCNPINIASGYSCKISCEEARDNGELWYRLTDCGIEFSFETSDDVTISGQAFLLDEEGYPLVPDNVHFKKFAKLFILTRLILNGYKHPVLTFQDASILAQQALPRAQNSLKFPSISKMENFKNRKTSYTQTLDSFSTGLNTNNL